MRITVIKKTSVKTMTDRGCPWILDSGSGTGPTK